jgi:hypothetical protein
VHRHHEKGVDVEVYADQGECGRGIVRHRGKLLVANETRCECAMTGALIAAARLAKPFHEPAGFFTPYRTQQGGRWNL